MFILRVVFVYLYFYCVHCKVNDTSDVAVDDDASQASSENLVFSKERLSDGNLNSTIEPSVCNYTDSRTQEEVEYYNNVLIDYPYAASIQRKGSHYANGALVNKRWVLSSAGEFYNVRESIKLFRVRLGSVDCKRGGTVFPIKSIQIHPFFVRREPNYDLALLKLALPVVEKFVMSPIPMSDVEGTVVSAKFLTVYWPRIVVNGKVLPSSAKERVKLTNMRVSTQELIPHKLCAESVEHLSNSSLCLEPVVTYHSVCTLDAGAPVVAKDGLWGITSGWVPVTCPWRQGPTVVTRVSTVIVRSWIDSLLHT